MLQAFVQAENLLRQVVTSLQSFEPRYDPSIGAWVLSRYADVSAALGDARLAVCGEPAGDVAREARVAVRSATRTSGFADLRSAFEASAADLVSRLPRGSSVDIVRELAAPWSLSMAMVAAGAHDDDRAQLASLARTVFLDAAHSTTGEPGPAAREAAATLAMKLGHGAIDVQSFVALSQTVPMFLASSWLALIRAGATFVDSPNVIEELLRFAGPSRAVFRQARTDIEIGNARIAAGQRVALMLARANRDPAKFTDPDTLDFARDASAHVALGRGSHSCVGASLVRMALRVGSAALFDATEEIAVADVQWIDGFSIHGPSSLVVNLRFH